MDILFLLVPLSVVLVLLIGALFWWALNSGQFDDLDTPAGMIFESQEAGKAMPEDVDGAPLAQTDPSRRS